MVHILSILVRLCVLAGRPQDLPASRIALAGSVVAAFTVIWAGFGLLTTTSHPVLLAAAHIALLAVVWRMILKIARRIDRWHQSACALFGSLAIVHLISLPIITASLDPSSFGEGGVDTTTRSIVVGLWAWEIAVTGRIIRETLEIRLPLAILVSILLSFALQIAMVILFGTSS